MTGHPPCDRLIVEFELNTRAVSKGRPRFTKTGRTYTDAKTAAYEQKVATACRAAMTGAPIWRDVEVWALFEQTDARRMDLDNALKALLDGMQGACLVNDRQVVAIRARTVLRANIDRVSVAVLEVAS